MILQDPKLLHYNSYQKLRHMRLERWLSGEKFLQYLQRPQGQFLAPISGGSQLFVTPAPGKGIPSVQILWAPALMHTYLYTDAHTQFLKKLRHELCNSILITPFLFRNGNSLSTGDVCLVYIFCLLYPVLCLIQKTYKIDIQ